MTGTPLGPLFARWQMVGVSVAIIATIIGPTILVAREISSIEERMSFVSSRLDKIEAHDADTTRRFEEQYKLHSSEEARIQSLELKMCLKHLDLCK